MGISAFLYLAASLALFLFSTRQFHIGVRALIWLAGAALLAAGVLAMLQQANHSGLISMIIDLIKSDRFSQSAFAQTLPPNWRVVSGNLTPMFDLLVAPTLIAAVFALIAFTPGETVENIVRPFTLLLLGAIGGGFLALMLVAAGFGGYAKDRVFAGVLADENAIDGDTIRIGGASLRLWGVDAPEKDQICLTERGSSDCGRDARAQLANIVRERMIVCHAPPDLSKTRGDLKQTFGRPIVTCEAYANGDKFDLARSMAELGYADVYRDNKGRPEPEYCDAVMQARKDSRGMWKDKVLSPRDWRNSKAARNAFKEGKPAAEIPACIVAT